MKRKPEGFRVDSDGRRTLSCVVTSEEAGSELLSVLLRRFPSYTREAWLDAIASQALTLDGVGTSPDIIVVGGMTIACCLSLREEPSIDDRYCILYEDEQIAVINKSGNLPCHPAGRYYEHTLVRLLLARNHFTEAHLVNRIDRETSGLVLVAKTAAAASRCGRALMDGHFRKSYWVLVEGVWPSTELPRTVSGVIRLECGGVVRKKRVFTQTDEQQIGESVQSAETRFRFLSSDGVISLLEAEPITGRPHQIRATLKAIGYPVVGDKLYGVDESIYARMGEDAITDRDWSILRMKRQALHARCLAFRHPVTREDLSFEAPLPDDEPLWRI